MAKQQAIYDNEAELIATDKAALVELESLFDEDMTQAKNIDNQVINTLTNAEVSKQK